jgi:ribonucleotide monophosphatase NagD (HAD superfamily)
LKKLEHLEEIHKSYDTFIVDLWGVMHDGVKLNDGAIKTIRNLKKKNKKVVFLSNAPRPNKDVIKFLK